MDFDEERDYADQGSPTDLNMDSSLRHEVRHQASNATFEAHALLRTFSCIEWECKLYSGRPRHVGMIWTMISKSLYHSHDIIVNIIAYDIIVNIIPVISGRLELCTTRALGQPLLASLICLVYISPKGLIESSQLWASWDATGCTLYQKVQGSSLYTPLMMYGVHIFSWANHIFFMDFDIIGELWT
jgi:hypothetical protein